MRSISFNLNDKLLWNELLPGIMNNKEDEEIRVMSQLHEKEGDSSDMEE